LHCLAYRGNSPALDDGRQPADWRLALAVLLSIGSEARAFVASLTQFSLTSRLVFPVSAR
jgi:hypothetical protein